MKFNFPCWLWPPEPGIGVTEFAPMGLLPVIAGDLHVSIPTAGLLISAYAFGVVIGAPLMTLTTGSVRRRTLLIGLAGIFTLGNVMAAMADSYGMLMAARIVTSFNHGAFSVSARSSRPAWWRPTGKRARLQRCSPALPSPMSWAYRLPHGRAKSWAGARRSGASPHSASSPWPRCASRCPISPHPGAAMRLPSCACSRAERFSPRSA
jgi:hypothetical protein